MSIYTAGIPAEYGRKMGGVVEISTQRDFEPGFHGQVSLYGGSFDSAGAFANGQYSWGKNVLRASGDSSRTDHYLNPVVPQNYSNTGTLGDFSVDYRREVTPNDKLTMNVRHEIARYDIPNELIQQAAGQPQSADNVETIGIVSYQHLFSANAVGDLHGMVRDNSNDFDSNPEATPIEVFQHNSFRDGYFNASFTFNRGRHEWKVGVESDNTLLHENTSYNITDSSLFDDGTPLTFAFQGGRPDLEQAFFVQDMIHLNRWTISAGLRWDHCQLLLNQQAVQPRFSIARNFEPINTVIHFSYDRVFQTPSLENLLLSSSDAVKAISPNFLRLPVKPSQGDYYEIGLSSVFAKHLKLNANYFRRFVNDYADDDQIDNTPISFPIFIQQGSHLRGRRQGRGSRMASSLRFRQLFLRCGQGLEPGYRRPFSGSECKRRSLNPQRSLPRFTGPTQYCARSSPISGRFTHLVRGRSSVRYWSALSVWRERRRCPRTVRTAGLRSHQLPSRSHSAFLSGQRFSWNGTLSRRSCENAFAGRWAKPNQHT
jgi:hypothetical protein